MTGILETIRKLVGAGDSVSPFDTDILIHINSAFFTLRQLGAGPSTGFVATDTSVWTEFISDATQLEAIKTYVYLKVRLIFDPPSSSAALDAMKSQADQYEVRIRDEVDPGYTPVEEVGETLV